MDVDYNHSENLHTSGGARAALPIILESRKPKSLLDVGCGTGTWLKAAQELGVAQVLGVDGVDVAGRKFLVSESLFKQVNLQQSWDLARRFDVVLCLEVAEHLAPVSASLLVRCLTVHGDLIYFGAACPGQEGQHHVNCQWPAYWQNLFNHEGFRCDDSVRWRIWEDERIEPWYRQNMFLAVRDPEAAGKEKRIHGAIHPGMFGANAIPSTTAFRRQILEQVQGGSESLPWYLGLTMKALSRKIARRLRNSEAKSAANIE